MKKLSVSKSDYSTHSVLSTGRWYKIKVNEDGIYKLTYTQLKQMGFSNPGNVCVYGNGGGMLPLNVFKPRPDDLHEKMLLYMRMVAMTGVIFYSLARARMFGTLIIIKSISIAANTNLRTIIITF